MDFSYSPQEERFRAELHADGMWPHLFLYSRGRAIAAAGSEIQRNIIAERVLGLPRGR